MITDRIGRHEVLLPINHKNYNFLEKKNTSVFENIVIVQGKKKFSILKKAQFRSLYTVSLVIETKVVIG